MRAKNTHCRNGHEYTVENTQITEKGWRRCRTCSNTTALKYRRSFKGQQYGKQYEANNYEKRKDTRLRRVYGVSLEEVRTMAEEQNHECKICSRSCVLELQGRGNESSFALDHCHKTSNIRGLLCHRCNKVLGLVKDDPELLFAMVKYLEN